MNTYQKVNRQLKRVHVTLRKGRGYQYFTFDDGDKYDSESLYWYSIADSDIDYLVREGEALARRNGINPDELTPSELEEAQLASEHEEAFVISKTR